MSAEQDIDPHASDAAPPQMPTPQPIDSAPKDGTVILGFAWRRRSDGGERVYRCWWQPEFDGWITGCREMTLAAAYRFADGKQSHLHSPDHADPTHWLPWPSKPEVRS